jgi:hypothetical protein
MLMQLPDRGSDGVVFKYAGRGMADITQGIETGCADAGIVYGRFKDRGFIFRDLRHCFATYARKAGVPQNVIMAIMGHSMRDDMNAHNDLAGVSDLLQAGDQTEVFSGNSDQNGDQKVGRKGSSADSLPQKSLMYTRSATSLSRHCHTYSGPFLFSNSCQSALSRPRSTRG